MDNKQVKLQALKEAYEQYVIMVTKKNETQCVVCVGFDNHGDITIECHAHIQGLERIAEKQCNFIKERYFENYVSIMCSKSISVQPVLRCVRKFEDMTNEELIKVYSKVHSELLKRC